MTEKVILPVVKRIPQSQSDEIIFEKPIGFIPSEPTPAITVKNLRTFLKISKLDMGLLIGIHSNSIANLESGKAKETKGHFQLTEAIWMMHNAGLYEQFLHNAKMKRR